MMSRPLSLEESKLVAQVTNAVAVVHDLFQVIDADFPQTPLPFLVNV
jgi:hypothetical protein